MSAKYRCRSAYITLSDLHGVMVLSASQSSIGLCRFSCSYRELETQQEPLDLKQRCCSDSLDLTPIHQQAARGATFLAGAVVSDDWKQTGMLL